MEPVRKFKIIVNSKECGTCSGATPSAVAKKVVKKLCGTSSKVVTFRLKECKRGCERVCGPYQGRMEKLDKPYKRDGKKITHRVVCGKVRKMRGGRDLVAEDFDKEKNNNYNELFKSYQLHNKKKFSLLSIKKKSNTNKQQIHNYNNKLLQLSSSLHYHVKIEENKNNNILYAYFGTITIYVNNFGYKNYYKYVIFIDNKNNVIFLQLNPDFSITHFNFHKNRIDDELKDYLLKLYKKLENESNDKKLRIQNFIKKTLKINNDSVNSNLNKSINVHSEPETLPNGCIKYPANYKFSGKNKNGILYSTNKLFRGNSKSCKLYLFNPTENIYNLLLTELDYLVNVYDINGNPFQITYSGLFFREGVIAGSVKINIDDIEKFLYCPQSFSNLNKKITLQVKNDYFNNRSFQFPCWIIFKKETRTENKERQENQRRREEENQRRREEENQRRREEENQRRREEENQRRRKSNTKLTFEDFSKEHYIGEFTIKEIDGQKYFFIGHNNDNYTLVYYTGDSPTSLVILILFKKSKKFYEITSNDYNRILKQIVQRYRRKTQRGNINIKPDDHHINPNFNYLYAILQNFCNDLMGNTEWFKDNPIDLMNEISSKNKNELLEYHRKIRAKKIAKSYIYEHSDTVNPNKYTEEDFLNILSDQSITENFGLDDEINIMTGETLDNAIQQCRHDLKEALGYFYKNDNLHWLKQHKKNRKQILFSSTPFSFYDVLNYI